MKPYLILMVLFCFFPEAKIKSQTAQTSSTVSGIIKPKANNTAQTNLQKGQDLKPGLLFAGVAKVEITNKSALKINDPLYVKALVLKKDEVHVVIVTVDAVAIGGIGTIGNDFLAKVRKKIQDELGISPGQVVVNASHCHGIVCNDVDLKTFEAVKKALERLVPVLVGVGSGQENRISENRRLRLKNGKEADVRHAYSMPSDEDVTQIGPIDPEIGILRLDRSNGQTLAVVYNFACHPIMGVPSGENSADIVGFASKVIENSMSLETMAFFVQGCAGDINPVLYKEVDQPRNAEPLGNMLGLSVVRAARKIDCSTTSQLRILCENISLPRADLTEPIEALLLEQTKLLNSLQGTSLNLKTFMPLMVKYNLSPLYPSSYSHRYMLEKAWGNSDLDKLDEANRQNMKLYLNNILAMEQLTRLQTNLALLRKHNATNLAAGRKPLEAEMVALRIGEFVMVTFPGELTVEIGLNIKKSSPYPKTFVAGYTNGYIYYTPTAKQLKNRGNAQEDSDCLLAPEWQKLFEDKVTTMLKQLKMQ